MQSIHYDDPPYEERIIFDLDEIGRQGVRKMLVQALEAEVEKPTCYVEAAKGECDEHGAGTCGAQRPGPEPGGPVRGEDHRGEDAEGERPRRVDRAASG